MMEEAPLLDLLVDYGNEAGIHLSERQAFLCSEHVRLMLEWNRRLNLTRITLPDQIIIKHILDSLLPARWLPQDGHALDVGTGPGFPGIPLKILQPALKMTLLEAQRKKISFLRVVLSKLALEDAWAVQGRWEEMERTSRGGPPARFDLITMRALRLEHGHLVGLGRLLAEGGMLVWWAGPGADQGRSESFPREALDQVNVDFAAEHSYTLPTLSERRRILIWKRREQVTPGQNFQDHGRS